MGPDDDIHPWGAALDLAAILLRETARDHDLERGVAILDRLEVPQVPVQLVVRVLTDRACVQHHHAGTLDVVRRGHAVGRQQAGDALRVMLVHLTSEGADQVGAVHASERIANRTVRTREARVKTSRGTPMEMDVGRRTQVV